MQRMAFRLVVMVASVAALAVVAGLWVSGSSGLVYLHMGIALATALVLTFFGVQDTNNVVEKGGAATAVAAAKARSMGIVWLWCALGVLVSYGLGLVTWKEWWQFAIPFGAVAALCLYTAASLGRSTSGDSENASTLRVLSIMNKVQLVGTVIAMIGLLVDRKMVRFLSEAGQRPQWQDWAANNFFFFGALALALLSLHAISGRAQARAPTTGRAAQ